MYTNGSLAAAISPDRLELILLPTEKCNFRCTYCYEDFAVGRMKKPVVDGVKALIRNRVPHLKVLTLSWFGGEPLLARELVMSISAHAKELCEAHGVHFSGGLTTNGFLLDPGTFDDLVRLDQTHYQITLDGDPEWHDKTRVQANRRPTFNTIWANLEACAQSSRDFHVSLRLHLHEDNVESMKRLYERVKSRFLTDKRFSASFHRIGALGQALDSGPRLLSRPAYEAALSHVRGRGDDDVAVGSDLDLSDYICYAAKPNSLLIRANGDIGKCTVILDDPRNALGRILPDGTLDIDNVKLRHWMAGFLDTSKPTLSCPLGALPKVLPANSIEIVTLAAE